MIRRALIAFVLALAAPCAAEARELVLVVSAGSPIDRLDSIELRKLYLGFSVQRDGRPLQAFRNRADPRIDEVFLQNVVAMTDVAYERRLLANTMQRGLRPPEEFRDRTALLDALAREPTAVSFAWLDEVARNPRVRVLRVLWRD